MNISRCNRHCQHIIVQQMVTKAGNPAANVQNCTDIAGGQRHRLGNLRHIRLHPVREGRAAAGKHEPIPLDYNPVLVGLGHGEIPEGHVGDPDAAAALRPRNGGEIAGRARDAAGREPISGGRAVALAVGEVSGGEEAIAAGVLAGTVVGEVLGAKGEDFECYGGGYGGRDGDTGEGGGRWGRNGGEGGFVD